MEIRINKNTMVKGTNIDANNVKIVIVFHTTGDRTWRSSIVRQWNLLIYFDVYVLKNNSWKEHIQKDKQTYAEYSEVKLQMKRSWLYKQESGSWFIEKIGVVTNTEFSKN